MCIYIYGFSWYFHGKQKKFHMNFNDPGIEQVCITTVQFGNYVQTLCSSLFDGAASFSKPKWAVYRTIASEKKHPICRCDNGFRKKNRSWNSTPTHLNFQRGAINLSLDIHPIVIICRFSIHPMENRLFEIFALPHLGMCLRACTVSTYICTVCMYFFVMCNENFTYQSRKVLFTCLYTYEFLTFLSIVHMVLFVIMFCALK